MSPSRSLGLLSLVAALSACGGQEKAPAAAEAPAAPAPAPVAEAPAAAPAASTEVAAGEAVFKKTCAMCHQTGAAGAPKLGDKADWGPRLAQGKDTLYKHALEGFNGNKGAMPAKGGNPSLSDDDVKAAVDFMAGKSA
ncbi:c-type cytochrome [Microvirgula aerodenitrificans]|uniref:c-type cytochrome n=1 Tax=Microvirgula aerodenitrificans TaxID=57480 RepID=UPI000490A3F2|nr:c-type cytochrome [Microvirgula aerodenitrificans]